MTVAATDLWWIGVVFPSYLLLEKVGTEIGGGEGRQPGGKGTFAFLVEMKGCCLCSDKGLVL